MTVISGTAYWASVVTPNTTFDSDGVWQIDVCLDDENLSVVQGDGLNVKNKGDERGNFITIKRKVRNARGDNNQPPSVVDSEKNPIKDTLIGNGSKVNVMYKPYEYTYQGRAGKSADLQVVQVVDLVEYSGSKAEDALPVVDGGYKHDTTISEDVPF